MSRMRATVIVVAIACSPIAIAAQASPPPPIITTGQTAIAARAAMANTPAAAPDGGGLNSPAVRAQETLNSIRAVCTLVEHEGKLFAACDNSTPAARTKGATHLPQLSTEWEQFARRLVDADWLANGKRRPVVILNNGEVIAESTSGGVVRLKK